MPSLDQVIEVACDLFHRDLVRTAASRKRAAKDSDYERLLTVAKQDFEKAEEQWEDACTAFSMRIRFSGRLLDFARADRDEAKRFLEEVKSLAV